MRTKRLAVFVRHVREVCECLEINVRSGKKMNPAAVISAVK